MISTSYLWLIGEMRLWYLGTMFLFCCSHILVSLTNVMIVTPQKPQGPSNKVSPVDTHNVIVHDCAPAANRGQKPTHQSGIEMNEDIQLGSEMSEGSSFVNDIHTNELVIVAGNDDGASVNSKSSMTISSKDYFTTHEVTSDIPDIETGNDTKTGEAFAAANLTTVVQSDASHYLAPLPSRSHGFGFEEGETATSATEQLFFNALCADAFGRQFLSPVPFPPDGPSTEQRLFVRAVCIDMLGCQFVAPVPMPASHFFVVQNCMPQGTFLLYPIRWED